MPLHVCSATWSTVGLWRIWVWLLSDREASASVRWRGLLLLRLLLGFRDLWINDKVVGLPLVYEGVVGPAVTATIAFRRVIAVSAYPGEQGIWVVECDSTVGAVERGGGLRTAVLAGAFRIPSGLPVWEVAIEALVTSCGASASVRLGLLSAALGGVGGLACSVTCGGSCT